MVRKPLPLNPLSPGVAYRVITPDGVTVDVPATPATPGIPTGCVAGRHVNMRRDSGTHARATGCSYVGGPRAPRSVVQATREVAQRLAQPPANTKLTRTEKRRARSRARAARHRNLGGNPRR